MLTKVLELLILKLQKMVSFPKLEKEQMAIRKKELDLEKKRNKILLIQEEIAVKKIVNEVITLGLQERINEDLKACMKSKDTFKLGVIRMVKGAVQLEKINLKKDELSDEEIIKLISKQIKMRKDSISEFAKAGRDDLVNQNEKEIEVLKDYMPEEMNEEEVINIINEAIENTGASNIKEMGKVMREVTPKVSGRFDMGRVSSIIKDKLNSN